MVVSLFFEWIAARITGNAEAVDCAAEFHAVTATVAFLERFTLGSTGAADRVHQNRWSWRATIDEGTSFPIFFISQPYSEMGA